MRMWTLRLRPSQSSGAYFQTQTVVPHLNCQNIVLPSRGDSSLRVWEPSLSSQFQLHKLTVQTGRLADSAAVCLPVGGWGGSLWVAATGPPTGLYKGDLALTYSGMIIRKWCNQPNRGSESFQRVGLAFFTLTTVVWVCRTRTNRFISSPEVKEARLRSESAF